MWVQEWGELGVGPSKPSDGGGGDGAVRGGCGGGGMIREVGPVQVCERRIWPG